MLKEENFDKQCSLIPQAMGHHVHKECGHIAVRKTPKFNLGRPRQAPLWLCCVVGQGSPTGHRILSAALLIRKKQFLCAEFSIAASLQCGLEGMLCCLFYLSGILRALIGCYRVGIRSTSSRKGRFGIFFSWVNHVVAWQCSTKTFS